MIKKQQAYVYQLPKTTMQSGQGKTKGWVLEFKLQTYQFVEPTMHWTGCHDTQSQVKLVFESLDQAQAYIHQHDIQATILPSHSRHIVPKNYSSNFKY